MTRAVKPTTIVAEKGRVISRYSERVNQLATEYAVSRDPVIRQKLILANLPLVKKIAYRYRKFVYDENDLIQEGFIGLMIAINKFDLSRGVSFATYATPWIRLHVQTAAWHELSVVKTNIREKKSERLDPSSNSETDYQQPTYGISKALRHRLECGTLSTREQRRQAMLQRDIPLNQCTNGSANSDDSHTYMDLVSPLNARPTDESIAFQETCRTVKSVFSQLDERAQDILTMRLLKDEPASGEAVGNKYKITVARVNQIKKRALEQLREKFIRIGVASL
ncbi:MAG: sigma-70 family RNA polymerase sigma factor [Patescibacteria group bacterium]